MLNRLLSRRSLSTARAEASTAATSDGPTESHSVKAEAETVF